MKKWILGFGVLGLAISPGDAKTYEAIRGESRISYILKHPMHKVVGESKKFTCKVELSEDTLGSMIAVKAPVMSFNSGNSNRDSHTMELLEAFKFPNVEFASDSVRRVEKGYRVFGQLTFHGVKRPVEFEVVPAFAGDKIRITGSFTVKLTDYKLKRPTLLMVPTENDLRIELDLVAAGP